MSVFLILLLILFAATCIFLLLKVQSLKKAQADFSELNRKYRKILEINRNRKMFAAKISHDLASPLATIDMWVQLLKSEAKSLSEEQNKAVDNIQKTTQFGHDLMRKMVELENAIPEKVILENFDFTRLLKKLVEEVKPLQINDAYFVPDIQDNVFLLSDELMIRKMCESILITVICNVEAKSKIQVALFSSGEQVVFTVKSDPVEIAMNKVTNMLSSSKQMGASKKGGEMDSTATALDIANRIAMELSANFSSEITEMGESILKLVFKND
jgi:light-regulated signal transduction histidine kinase (bacteriophytochrome)